MWFPVCHVAFIPVQLLRFEGRQKELGLDIQFIFYAGETPVMVPLWMITYTTPYCWEQSKLVVGEGVSHICSAFGSGSDLVLRLGEGF